MLQPRCRRWLTVASLALSAGVPHAFIDDRVVDKEVDALNHTGGDSGWHVEPDAGVRRAAVLDADGRVDVFAYHKEFLPLDNADFLCLLVAAAGLVIAAGGGIGGGGILVPLYIILLGFRPKHAVALSNFTILGGAMANTIHNSWKTDASGNSLIDWDIIVMMEPSTLAGTVIGSFLSKYLPDFVLSLSLGTILAMLSFRTLDKGCKMFRRETEDERHLQGEPIPGEDGEDCELSEEDEPGVGVSRTLMGNGRVRASGVGTPWFKVLLLSSCFLGCVVLTILKGGGHGSVIGIECGSASFWLLSWACIPWVIAFGVIFRRMLIAETEVKEQDGHEFQSTDIRWDSKTTIRYPLLCTLAGILAGLFGVGGGIVKGPLMLEMGVSPRVAAATAATMILFTSGSACVSFQVFGLLEPTYGQPYFVLGFGCTVLGQWVVNEWMQGAKRQSPPVLSIGVVMALSTFLVLLQAAGDFESKDFAELIVPSDLCSDSA